MKRFGIAILCLFAGTLPRVSGDATPWWNGQWPHRRTIEATPPAGANPGADVAVVDFLTMGQVQPDGRDLRVVARNQVMPSKVLMMGPGDRCLLAFEMAPGVTTYHVYFGNPKAEPMKEPWEPRRGLLLEGFVWTGGGADNLNQALASIRNAKPKQGAAFVPQINHGWNPFGPSENYVHVYTGWLQCPEEGLYTFAVSAEHAAFLLIDGKPVVQWGGWHGPVWDTRVRGQVQLTRGQHLVKFYHIQGRGQWNTAVVAWSLPSWNKTTEKNPTQLRFEVVPAAAFSPVAQARLVDLETQGKTIVLDFTVENVGKAWLTGDQYLVRCLFKATAKPGQLAGARVAWDFGDRTTASTAEAEHIYVNPGTYTVSLSIQKFNVTYTTAHTLVIEQDWNRQPDQRIDGLGSYALALAKREYGKLRPADLNTVIDVFVKLNWPDEAAKAARAFLLVTEGVSEGLLVEKALVLAAILCGQKRHDEALRMLPTVEPRVTSPALKARIALRTGEIRMDPAVKDLAGAAREFNRILKDYGTARDDAVRWAMIRLADVHRKQGEVEKATALYERAGAVQPVRSPFNQNLVRPGAPRPVRVSSYARTVEAFLFEKKADDAELLLNSWEWDYPDERLKGHTALLRARLWALKGNHALAAEEAEDLAAFDERNPYVPEALFLAGESYEKLKDAKRAAATYQRLVDDYPESPFVQDARKRLKALGGGLTGSPRPRP